MLDSDQKWLSLWVPLPLGLPHGFLMGLRTLRSRLWVPPIIPIRASPPAWCLPTVGLLLGSNICIFGPDLLHSCSIDVWTCPPALFRAENGQIWPRTGMCWQHDQEHILV